MSQPTAPIPPRPRRLRRVLRWFGLGLLGFLVVLVSCISVLTKDVVAAGNRFLEAMTGPNPAAAWQQAGPPLQQAVPQAAFQRWVEQRGLQGGTVSVWSSRNRNNAAGSLDGTLTLRGGGSLPLHLDLRQNAAGEWQVVGVSVEQDGARPGTGS